MADPAFDIVYTAPDSGVSGVVTGGTLTFQYPTGRAAASYAGQGPALMNARGLQANFLQDKDFTISYGATAITVTYLGPTTIPVGTVVGLQIPVLDTSDQFDSWPYSPPTSADGQYVAQTITPAASVNELAQTVVPAITVGL